MLAREVRGGLRLPVALSGRLNIPRPDIYGITGAVTAIYTCVHVHVRVALIIGDIVIFCDDGFIHTS